MPSAGANPHVGLSGLTRPYSAAAPSYRIRPICPQVSCGGRRRPGVVGICADANTPDQDQVSRFPNARARALEPPQRTERQCTARVYRLQPRTPLPQSGRGVGGSRAVAVCRLAAMPAGDLPIVEFAFPGPLRDQLVAAILAGEKTTTTSLVADYERENEPLPVPRLRQVVVDSAGSPVAVIETTAVRVMRLADVDLDHALGEGEAYASVAAWRAGHCQPGRLCCHASARAAVQPPGRRIRVVLSRGNLVRAFGCTHLPRGGLGLAARPGLLPDAS